MKFVADLHIHSKYSRATSPQMELSFLAETAKEKGILVLGTGDFTHPLWFDDLKTKLIEAEPGLFRLKENNSPTRFILTTEISCIYSQGGGVRKIHIVLFAPGLSAVERINTKLSAIGNLKADGRPILGLSAKDLTKIALEADENCFVVPAHIWTPWFAVFGSKSGFDSLEECFEEYSKYIYAIETGLSSDPAMNWRLSALDRLAIISCSDAHSPAKLGRETCVFDTPLNYASIISAVKNKNPKEFLMTTEFYPQEGKYHYDGHRSCSVRCSPQETKQYNGICPVCSKPLVVGVLNRVEKLADRPEGFKPEGAIPFRSLIPLQEIIAEALNCGVATKKTNEAYAQLIGQFESEFNILLDVPVDDVKAAGFPSIAEAIKRMREGRVHISPGYDGVYGKVSIFSESEKKDISGQKTLF